MRKSTQICVFIASYYYFSSRDSKERIKREEEALRAFEERWKIPDE